MGYVYDNAIGVKTGTTPEAGRCLVSAAVDGDEYLIAVILRAEPPAREEGYTDLKQIPESTALLTWRIRNLQRTPTSQHYTTGSTSHVHLLPPQPPPAAYPVPISRTTPHPP